MLRRSEENQIAVLPSSRILPPSTCLSIRTFCRRFVASSVLLLTLAPALLAAPKPLWPGSHYTEQDREAALERGLKFIYRIASNPANFSQSGPDLLFCFYTISSTARSHDLRNMARTMGRELALEWRRQHRDPPTDNAAEVYLFVLGTLASDGILGNFDPALRERVQQSAARFSARDFMQFDPRVEPPPSNIAESCSPCDAKTPVTFRSRYDVWLDSLIFSYMGESYGVTLGATYADVLKWIPAMRPYPPPADEDTLDDVSYAITHVVYTLNGYHRYRLSPSWLPQEFSYLRKNITEAEKYGDPEILGEFMDALRAFGEDDSSPEIQTAMEYLLSHQNTDGSWGNADDDVYTRYHTTWTAIDGLRQYSYHGRRLKSLRLLPLLRDRR